MNDEFENASYRRSAFAVGRLIERCSLPLGFRPPNVDIDQAHPHPAGRLPPVPESFPFPALQNVDVVSTGMPSPRLTSGHATPASATYLARRAMDLMTQARGSMVMPGDGPGARLVGHIQSACAVYCILCTQLPQA